MKENQNQFRLSIIVAIYNVEAYLERCLSSIVKQDLPPEEYEILLINDGSTDGSLAIAQKYEQQYSNVKVFSKENGGLSSVRNFGIENSKGRYIMHVDGDDFLVENVVGKVLNVAEENDLDLCFYPSLRYPSGIKLDAYAKFPHYQVFRGNQLILQGMEVSSTWSCIYRHDFLDARGVSYFDRIAHQDVEFNYRLYPFAERVMFTDIYTYVYNKEGESITRTKSLNKRQKSLLDNLQIASNVKTYYKKVECQGDVRKYIYRKMNSSLSAFFISFLRRDCEFGYHFAKDFLKEAKRLGVYPVRGRTLSWKTTLPLFFVNCRFLYLIVVRLINNK